MLNNDLFVEALNKSIGKILTKKPVIIISPDETFSNYGLDSLDQMSMLLVLEDEIGIKIGDVNINEYNTPTKLYNYILNDYEK